jgi:c(7)-type cytochrome triheme protein
MKRIFLIISIMVTTVAFAYAAVMPDKVDLKIAWGADGKQKAVIFNHTLHADNNNCTECHESSAGGKLKPDGTIVGLNDRNPAHKYCWGGCHVTKKVSVGKTCNKCHGYSYE